MNNNTSNSGDSLDFVTKYGNIKLTAATSSEFPDVDIRNKLNSVEIDDNPYNTYGLASKYLVLSSIESHNNSEDAHKELFNSFLSQLYELYESQGELHINTLSDVYSNKIFANGKMIQKGEVDNPKYIVASKDKYADYDELVKRVEALEAAVAPLTSA